MTSDPTDHSLRRELREIQKERAATGIAMGLTQVAVARDLNVTDRTIRRWTADPEFRLRVRLVRQQLDAELTGRLRAVVLGDVLPALLSDLSSDHWQLRSSAQRLLVNSVLKLLKPSDLEDRVVELEQVSRTLLDSAGSDDESR